MESGRVEKEGKRVSDLLIRMLAGISNPAIVLHDSSLQIQRIRKSGVIRNFLVRPQHLNPIDQFGGVWAPARVSTFAGCRGAAPTQTPVGPRSDRSLFEVERGESLLESRYAHRVRSATVVGVGVQRARAVAQMISLVARS